MGYLAKHTAHAIMPPGTEASKGLANLSQLALYPVSPKMMNGGVGVVGFDGPTIFNELPLTYPMTTIPQTITGTVGLIPPTATQVSPEAFFTTPPALGATNTFIPVGAPGVAFWNNTGTLFKLDPSSIPAEGAKRPVPGFVVFMQSDTAFPVVHFTSFTNTTREVTTLVSPSLVDLVDACKVLRVGVHDSHKAQASWDPQTATNNYFVAAYAVAQGAVSGLDVDRDGAVLSQPSATSSKPTWRAKSQDSSRWEQSLATTTAPVTTIVIQGLPAGPIAEEHPAGIACAELTTATTTISFWDASPQPAFIILHSPAFGSLKYTFVKGGATGPPSADSLGSSLPGIPSAQPWCTKGAAGAACPEPANSQWHCAAQTGKCKSYRAKDGSYISTDKCMPGPPPPGNKNKNNYVSLDSCRQLCGDQKPCFCEYGQNCGNIPNVKANDAPWDVHRVRCDDDVAGSLACGSVLEACDGAVPFYFDPVTAGPAYAACTFAAFFNVGQTPDAVGARCTIAAAHSPSCSACECKRYTDQCHCV